MSDAFESRGRALEDQFFHQLDQKLLDKFRTKLANKESREALKSSSGIADEELLDTLVTMNISAESLASLSIVPLVAVAWADGKMEPGEREAVLKAAEDRGMASGSAGYHMVEVWLSSKPAHELFEVWQAYVGALKETMEPAAYEKLKSEVLAQAHGVAHSAGGILGLANRVSPIEKAKLKELEESFG